MSKFDEIIGNLRFSLNAPENQKDNKDLNLPFDKVKNISDTPGKFCGIDSISDIFSWKKGFSYLWTGSPNTGKTTMVLFMFLVMSLRYGYKWCIWSPEMIDTYIKNKSVVYHAKDLIYLMIWTLTGKTPYEYYAKKHNTELLNQSEIESAYNWITDHFKFIEVNDRTPAGLIEAFKDFNDNNNFDGFLVDPWKSVKQDMNTRADLWLEDVLMEFKKFSYETNSIMNFVVHPKALKDYKDADGTFRVITPFDLNGGAAWSNSMDVIISLRRLEDRTEWYSHKIRKQHLIGKRGSYESINFNMDTYRFTFGLSDPFEEEKF
jgi:hypothetical protein